MIFLEAEHPAVYALKSQLLLRTELSKECFVGMCFRSPRLSNTFRKVM